jgi:V8-like Glu-specific endopeptidase
MNRDRGDFSAGDEVERAIRELCFSGFKTNRRTCGEVLGQTTVVHGPYSEQVYVVGVRSKGGDSGAPVWNPNRHVGAVGILTSAPKHDESVSFVAPLIPMPYVSSFYAPGALRAPGMFNLYLNQGG